MSLIAWSMMESHRTEEAQDGLKAIIRGYYEDYTDAVKLDDQTHRALEHLSEWADVDFDDWLIETEREVARDLERPLKALRQRTSEEEDDAEEAS